MKKNLQLIFGLILTISSCGSPVKSNSEIENDKSVTFIFDNIVLGSYSFDIEKIIPLETTQNNFLSDNLTVKFSSESIFVFDEQIRDAIHQFDSNGRYISEIITVGEGPENVSSISDFIVSGKNIEILSGKGAYSEIIYYSIGEKKIVDKLQLDLIGFSFEKIGEAYFIYSSYNYPYADFRVSKVDLQGNILEKYLENDYSGTMLPVIERNFFTTNGKTFLVESFSNQIYEVTKDHVKLKYIIDYGRKNVPRDFFDTDLMTSFEKLSNEGFYSILNHFEGENIEFTNIVFQQENNSEHFQIFFQKEKQEIGKIKLQDSWRELLRYPVGINQVDQIVYSISPQILIKNAKLFNIKLSGLGLQDNPVLVYMKVSN